MSQLKYGDTGNLPKWLALVTLVNYTRNNIWLVFRENTNKISPLEGK